MTKHCLKWMINAADKLFGLRAMMRENEASPEHPLAGDRAVEWSWMIKHLPREPADVLDLGCVQSVLTGTAARMGHRVTAVDLREIEYEMPNVTFVRQNFLKIDFGDNRFDVIMNCSFIEHVGLKDRYGSTESPDGDLIAMHALGRLLSPRGRMVLTIPIGRDAELAPFHRVYGGQRLPRLLADYRILEEEYWHKAEDRKWRECRKETAMETRGSFEFYALGLFVLERSDG
jgi:2-polyprenyl-3-methyl-5-hydroxy-6-metoxy-1,4-benzoquinol methylase